MKRSLTTVACALALFSTTNLLAQEAPGSSTPAPVFFSDHELMIGHGILPGPQMNTMDDHSNSSNIRHNRVGAFFLSYHYHFGRALSIGVTAAYEHEHITGATDGYYLVNGNLIQQYAYPGEYTRSTFTIAPELGISYFNTRNGMLRLYGVFGMGYGIYNINATENLWDTYDGSRNRVRVNAYVAPIGIRCGRTLSGFVEMGVGYKGLFNYGLSYRF